MRVYITGGTITVDKTGIASLKIPQNRAKFLSEGDNIRVSDTVITGNERVDLTVNIQDVNGAGFASTQATINYLSTFIFISGFLTVTEEASTAANQATIIAQNTTIQGQLTDLDIDLDVLDNIKDEQKTSNKILKKIYNP